MIASFVIALYLAKSKAFELETHEKLLINIGLTTVIWLAVTFMTPATNETTLSKFYRKIKPAGWHKFKSADETNEQVQNLSSEIAAMIAAVILVFAILFGLGYLLFGEFISAGITILLSLIHI